jgi:hypothetical protein
MKKIIIIFLFLVGLVATALLGFYVIALFLYVLEGGGYPGAIAFIPRWVFLFSPFVLLWRTKEVQRFMDYFS